MQKQQETFKAQLMKCGRITIDAHLRKWLNLSEGDWVEVTIKKAEA